MKFAGRFWLFVVFSFPLLILSTTSFRSAPDIPSTISLSSDTTTDLSSLSVVMLALLGASFAWRLGSRAHSDFLDFTMNYVCIPVFVASCILMGYLVYLRRFFLGVEIDQFLVHTYVNQWLSQAIHGLLLGLFLGLVFGFAVPSLRSILLKIFAKYIWLVSGRKLLITNVDQPHRHDRFLFFSRSIAIAILFLLVWAPTSPIIPARQNADPPFTLYGFNSYYLVSLLLVPLFVGLGEHMGSCSFSGTKLSDPYFRWLFSALSIGGVVAVIVAVSQNQNQIDPLGLAYAGIPILETILTFAGASVTFPLGVGLAELGGGGLSKVKAAARNTGWISATISLFFTKTLLQSIVAYPVGSFLLPLYDVISMLPVEGFWIDLSEFTYVIAVVLSTLIVRWRNIRNYSRRNIAGLIAVVVFATWVLWEKVLPSLGIWGFVLGLLLIVGILDWVTKYLGSLPDREPVDISKLRHFFGGGHHLWHPLNLLRTSFHRYGVDTDGC